MGRRKKSRKRILEEKEACRAAIAEKDRQAAASRRKREATRFPAPTIPAQHMARYAVYIRSEEWRRKRTACVERDERTCQACGAQRVALHAHHVTYDRIFHEDIDDLISLCVPCHDMIHLLARTQRAEFPTGGREWQSLPAFAGEAPF